MQIKKIEEQEDGSANMEIYLSFLEQFIFIKQGHKLDSKEFDERKCIELAVNHCLKLAIEENT